LIFWLYHMPLNSHSYLVAQGWQGTGKALREGAISRPVVIAQKKSLAGVGKDRDEAYPFWDHVFTAAASSIKVKVYSDDGDDDSDTPQSSGSSTPLDRTSTGIISNKPQKVGLSALTALTVSEVTGLSVMALAKRESARRCLYSQFFRGPVLGPGVEEPQVLTVAQRSLSSQLESNDPKSSVSATEKRKGKKRESREEGEEEGARVARKKRKFKRENGTKGERKERGRVEKGAENEVIPGGEVELGPPRMSTVPVSSAQRDGIVDYFCKKDVKKKKKRKGRESAIRHADG